MSNAVQGKYFEELEIGTVFRHVITRTVTETDNLLFTVMTMNTQPLHLDAEPGSRHVLLQLGLLRSCVLRGEVGLSGILEDAAICRSQLQDLADGVAAAAVAVHEGHVRAHHQVFAKLLGKFFGPLVRGRAARHLLQVELVHRPGVVLVLAAAPVASSARLARRRA